MVVGLAGSLSAGTPAPYSVGMEQPHPQRWLGVLALVGCALLWSMAGPLIKTLNGGDLGGPVPGITIAMLRSLLGGAVFVPLAWRHRGTLSAVPLRWPVLGVATFTLMTACFVIANTQTEAANAIVLQYTSPIWVFLLAPLLLGERQHPRDVLWLLLAMVGVATILALQWQTDLPGLVIALGAGVGYGALTVVLRALARVHPTTVVALNFCGSGLLMLPFALLAGVSLSGPQWSLALLLGVVQMALPYVLFSWALARVPAQQAALIVLLEAVTNPILTWLVIGEEIPRATLLGAPWILGAVAGWIVQSSGRRPRPVPGGPPDR